MNIQPGITIEHLSGIADVNVGQVREYQLMCLTGKAKTPKTEQSKHMHKTKERNILIKHARKLGFSPIEIKRFLIFWDK